MNGDRARAFTAIRAIAGGDGKSEEDVAQLDAARIRSQLRTGRQLADGRGDGLDLQKGRAAALLLLLTAIGRSDGGQQGEGGGEGETAIHAAR